MFWYREWPTRIMRRMQSVMQQRVIAPALNPQGPSRVPLMARVLFSIPVIRDLPARLFAFGVKRVRLTV